LPVSYSKTIYMARLVQEDNKHGETHLKLSYSKPVYMARLVKEDNKHGEMRLELSYSKPVYMARHESGHVYWLAV
jgi:hypothetical protein